MNKKIILVGIIVITLFLFCVILHYNKSDKYDDLVIDKETWDKIISERTITDSNLLLSIKFNDYEIFYDNVNCTYYYSLIEGSSNRYNPYINYHANKNDIKIALDKKITDEVIEKDELILMLLYTDTDFSIYTLKCTTLPLLNINCKSVDDINKENDVDMDICLFDNRKDATSRLTKSMGKIHGKGGITYLFPKKGYKLSLTMNSLGNNLRNNNISLLGMRQDDDWILNAVYNDQEKVRNLFALNLWNESCADNNSFNLDNGNQYKFIELFFNNEYWGLYAIGYPIDEKQLNLDKENEYMFKKMQYNFAEENVLTQKELELEDYKLVNNPNDKKDAWNSLKNYYTTLLTSSDKKELYSISDINNVIDYYLFQELIQGNDNAIDMYMKNVYITIKRQNKNKVILYTPWDYDMCLGNIYDPCAENYTNKYKVEVDKTINFKFNAINALQELNDDKINELIKNRYADLRSNYWSEEHLKELLEKYSSQIYDSGAFRRDKERWKKGSYNDVDEKLTKVEDFLLKRVEYLDKYIENIK